MFDGKVKRTRKKGNKEGRKKEREWRKAKKEIRKQRKKTGKEKKIYYRTMDRSINVDKTSIINPEQFNINVYLKQSIVHCRLLISFNYEFTRPPTIEKSPTIVSY